MDATLSDVVEELQANRTQQSILQHQTHVMLGEMTDAIYSLVNTLQDHFLAVQRENALEQLEQLEREREAAAGMGSQPVAIPGEPPVIPDDWSVFEGVGITALISGLVAAIGGAFVGYVSGLVDIVKLGFKASRLGPFTAAVGNFVKAATTSARQFFARLLDSSFIKRASEMLKGSNSRMAAIFGAFVQNVKSANITQRLASMVKTTTNLVSSIFKWIVTGQSQVEKTVDIVGGVTKSVSNLWTKTISGFRSLTTAIKPLTKWMGGIGKLAASISAIATRLLVPIQAALTAWSVVGETTEIWKDDTTSTLTKLVRTTLTALGQIALDFIVLPLDLLKNAIGWIAGFFGFEEFKENIQGIDLGRIWTEQLNSLKEYAQRGTEMSGGEVVDMFGLETATPPVANPALQPFDLDGTLPDMVNQAVAPSTPEQPTEIVPTTTGAKLLTLQEIRAGIDQGTINRNDAQVLHAIDKLAALQPPIVSVRPARPGATSLSTIVQQQQAAQVTPVSVVNNLPTPIVPSTSELINVQRVYDETVADLQATQVNAIDASQTTSISNNVSNTVSSGMPSTRDTNDPMWGPNGR